MANRRLVDFPKKWKIHLIMHVSCLLEFPASHTVASYLRSSNLSKSARVWINQRNTYDLIASTITDGLGSDHWFSRMKPHHREMLLEHIFESMKRGRTSLAHFARRHNIPLRNVYTMASSEHLKWLRGEVGRLRREWKRLAYYLYQKTVVS